MTATLLIGDDLSLNLRRVSMPSLVQRKAVATE